CPALRASLPALSTAIFRRRRPLSGSKKYASAAPMAPARANSGISQSPCIGGGFAWGYPEAARPNSLLGRGAGTTWIRGKSAGFSWLVAPVEVARASPEAIVGFGFHGSRLLRVVFAGPLEGDRRLRRDGRLR